MTIKLPQRRVTNAANNTCVRITEGASTGGVRLPLPVKRTGPRPSPLKLTVRCTACRHQNATRLNLALIAGESARSVARTVWSQQIGRCSPSFSLAANPCRGQGYSRDFAGGYVDRPSLQNSTSN